MKDQFNKGLLLTSLGSFWWGFIGVLYFQYVSFIGHVELVVHRCLWTAVMLIITTTILAKWNTFLVTISNKKNLLFLFFSGLLIFINWAVWIYAVATERIIDASFGYFIMPIISVLLGYIFFREKLNKKYLSKINMIKDKLKDKKTSDEEAMELRTKLQKIPLNALAVRKRNRCALTGRPRGVYRKFTLGRTKLREMAMQGLIPGLTKASW